jgi:hypothetical protein
MLCIGYGEIRESGSLTQPRISLRSIRATKKDPRPQDEDLKLDCAEGAGCLTIE